MARSFLKATSDYLSASGAGVKAAPLTLACFIRVDAPAFHAAVSLDNGGSHAFFLGVNNTGKAQAQINAPGSGGFSQAVSTTSVSVNIWHHIAGVYRSPSSRDAYVDGGGKGSDTTTVTPASMSRTELGRVAGFATYLDGALAEVGIWSVALSNEEIRRLAVGWSPLSVRPGALVFHAPLAADEDFDVVRGLSLAGSGVPGVRAHPSVISPPGYEVRSIGRSVVDRHDVTEHRYRRRIAAVVAGAPATRIIMLDDALIRVAT